MTQKRSRKYHFYGRHGSHTKCDTFCFFLQIGCSGWFIQNVRRLAVFGQFGCSASLWMKIGHFLISLCASNFLRMSKMRDHRLLFPDTTPQYSLNCNLLIGSDFEPPNLMTDRHPQTTGISANLVYVYLSVSVRMYVRVG